MRIAVCEDNAIHAKNLIKHIKESSFWTFNFNISAFNNAEELLFTVVNNNDNFDIIFFDIIMDGMNGFEAAVKIRKLDTSAVIIFITSDTSYVYSGYEINAFRYILKPVTADMIDKVLGEAIKQLYKPVQDITLNVGERIVKLNISDILYIETMFHKIYIHTITEVIDYYGKLSEEEIRYSSLGFAKCHRSYIVNMGQVKSIIKSEIILTNNESIPVSRQQRDEFLKKFTIYMGGFHVYSK
jgi:DNA-binding LytR/AlgR family response regulator